MFSLSEIRIGLIVNPLAGMGGSVGLKGTDGDLADRARALGAEPVAAARASRALQPLKRLPGLRLLSGAGPLGEYAVRDAGLPVQVVGEPVTAQTSAAETQQLAGRLLDSDLDLLLFAGGDGTARDILSVIATQVPVLGIPAGVKMHSAVFGASPRAAGELARRFVSSADADSLLQTAEVMDRPAGQDSASPELYGYLRVPRAPRLAVAAKAAAPFAAGSVAGACRRIEAMLHDDRVSLLGPGSTLQHIKSLLGYTAGPLSIDAWQRDRCLVVDGSEQQLWEAIGGRPARIVMTVIGGQGFLFGRGNQPLSPRIIRHVGRDNIVVVAALDKLTALPDGAFVDTGDERLDAELAGHWPVITGQRQTTLLAVNSASAVA